MACCDMTSPVERPCGVDGDAKLFCCTLLVLDMERIGVEAALVGMCWLAGDAT